MPKISARKSSQIIYYRESALVEDFLTLIGATKAAMDIMSEQIKRELRNQANRQSNFEIANLGKTIDAAAAQINAINELKSKGIFEEMTPQMQSLANLRIKHDDVSQKELGEMMQPPISKSQVSKIFAKIMKFHELYK